MGWYRVVKTIKGHRYIYEQRTWREGKHVRTESRYVGPADDGTPLGPIGGDGSCRREKAGSQASDSAEVTTTTTPQPPFVGAANDLSPTLIAETFATLATSPES